MQWINNIFGTENSAIVNTLAFGLIFLLVLLIIWLVIKMIRKPNFGSGRRGKQARLAVSDAAAVDSRRRLVLLRRDDVEHLIMIGGPTDIVIENDIRRNSPARPMATQNAPEALAPQVSASVAPSQPQQIAAQKPEAPAAVITRSPNVPTKPPVEPATPITPVAAPTAPAQSSAATVGVAAAAVIAPVGEAIERNFTPLAMPSTEQAPSSQASKPPSTAAGVESDLEAVLNEFNIDKK